jgi:hypothetical protein
MCVRCRPGSVEDYDMAEQQWFAARTIVANNEDQPWGPRDLDPGEIDYEERITIWKTDSADAPIALAQDECRHYVDDLGAQVLGLSQA